MTASPAGRRRAGARDIAVPDVALTGAVLAVTLAGAALVPSGWFGTRELDLAGAALLTGAVLPVLFRRVLPLTALVVNAVVQGPYHALDYPHEVVLPSVMVLLYAVAVSGSRKRLLLVPVLAVGLVTAMALAGDDPGLYVSVSLGWLLLAAVSGEAIRLHRAYLASLTERAEHAERTREQEAARRVAEERLRIARDLHDALAHSIVVINAHAAVAAHLLDEHRDDPVAKQVAEPLRTVATASSGALAELRTTLDVLRGNDPEPDRQPTPGIERLPELTEATLAAGVTTTLLVEGEPRPLGQGVEITLYRITQEALTNVVKHASATEAVVRLGYRPGEVRLEITDNGRGASPAGRGGYGIIGMTERASALGGELAAGPGDAGGFAVVATLPAAAQQTATTGEPT